jgi:hypothetical protein
MQHSVPDILHISQFSRLTYRHVEEQLTPVSIHIKPRNAKATTELMQWA